MSIAKRLVTNTVWLYGAEVATKLIQMFLIVVLARHYGPTSFGDYSFAMAFTVLFSVIVDFGMNTLIIREVSKNRSLASKYITNVLLIKSALGMLTLLLIFAAINIMGYPQEIKYLVYLFGIYNVLTNITELIKSFFKSYEFMMLDSIIKLSEKGLILALSLMVVYLGYSVMMLSLAFISAEVLVIAFSIVAFRVKISRYFAHIDKRFIVKFMKLSVPFALGSIFYTVYFRIDVVLVTALTGSTSTGIYQSAMQVIEVLLFVSMFLGLSVFPLLSQSFKGNKERFWRIIDKSFKMLFLFGVPIVVGTVSLGDRFVSLFFGEEYFPAGAILKILVFFMFFNFFAQFSTFILVAMNKENKLLLIMCFMVFFNVVLNYILIAYHSITGAAVAKVISEVVFLSSILIVVRPIIVKEMFIISSKTILTGTLLFLIIYALSSLNLFWIVSLTALIYALMIYLFRIITKEDVMLIREVLGSSAIK